MAVANGAVASGLVATAKLVSLPDGNPASAPGPFAGTLSSARNSGTKIAADQAPVRICSSSPGSELAPVRSDLFPAALNKFPVSVSREFLLYTIDFAYTNGTHFGLQRLKSAKFPVNFPVSREARPETGSL
jgi:hypothetical protein